MDHPEPLTCDNIEVHPWHEVGDGCVEQCEPHEAQGWGVYAHVPGEGLHHLVDRPTEAEDEDIGARLIVGDDTCPDCAGGGLDHSHEFIPGVPASCELCEGFGRLQPLRIVPLVYRDPHGK